MRDTLKDRWAEPCGPSVGLDAHSTLTPSFPRRREPKSPLNTPFAPMRARRGAPSPSNELHRSWVPAFAGMTLNLGVTAGPGMRMASGMTSLGEVAS